MKVKYTMNLQGEKQIQKNDGSDATAIPGVWFYGSMLAILSVTTALVAFSIWVGGHAPLWQLVGVGSVVCFLIGVSVQVYGFVLFRRNSSVQFEDIRKIRIASLDVDEVANDYSIVPNVGLFTESVNGIPKERRWVGDIVLARRSLCFLYRFNMPDKPPALVSYAFFGLLGGPLMDAYQKHQKAKEYRTALEAADRQRKEAEGKPLSQLVALNKSSFVIPVDGILRMERDDHGVLSIVEGVGKFSFAVGQTPASRFEQWLHEARKGCPLPSLEPNVLEVQNFNRILRSPTGQIEEDLKEFLLLLKRSTTVMVTFANTLNIATSRFIRKMKDAPRVLLTLRHVVLRSIVRKNMNYVMGGVPAAAVGSTILLIRFYSSGGWDTNIGGFEELIWFLIAMSLLFVGFPLSIIGFVVSWIANLELSRSSV